MADTLGLGSSAFGCPGSSPGVSIICKRDILMLETKNSAGSSALKNEAEELNNMAIEIAKVKKEEYKSLLPFRNSIESLKSLSEHFPNLYIEFSLRDGEISILKIEPAVKNILYRTVGNYISPGDVDNLRNIIENKIEEIWPSNKSILLYMTAYKNGLSSKI
jgi:hypothetical protein